MIHKVEFYYTQQFLRTNRCKRTLPFDVKSSADVVFKEVPIEGFPIAATYASKRESGFPLREYRYFEGRFWHRITIDIEYQFLNRFDSTDDGSDNTEAYEAAKADGTLIIKGDNRESIMAQIEEYAKNFLVCNGEFWEACSEPVIRMYKGEYTFIELSDLVKEHDVYNVNDIQWNNPGSELQVIMPEVFTYGRDDKVIADGVKEYFLKFWPKHYYLDSFAPKLVEKLLPKVVAKVKAMNPKPYIFSEKDVYVAMHEVMNELTV